MQLYYIRHAESTNNLLYNETGSDKGRSVDPEVTDRGRTQIEYLAKFLGRNHCENPEAPDALNQGSFGITHIYSSPMIRTLCTASGISREIGKKVEVWVDLHELGGIVEKDDVSGKYVGLPGYSRSYLVSRFPDFEFPADIVETGWWDRPHEPEEDRSARSKRVLERILARHGNTQDRVALVSHGAFYNRFMQSVTGFTRDELYLSMANTAITRIDFEQTYCVIRYMNRFDFLPNELVTH